MPDPTPADHEQARAIKHLGRTLHPEITYAVAQALADTREQEAERWKASIRETTWCSEIQADERERCAAKIDDYKQRELIAKRHLSPRAWDTEVALCDYLSADIRKG